MRIEVRTPPKNIPLLNFKSRVNDKYQNDSTLKLDSE